MELSKKNAKIITDKVNCLYMQSVIAKKGWSKQYAAYKVVEFLTCGKEISFFDFMEAAA